MVENCPKILKFFLETIGDNNFLKVSVITNIFLNIVLIFTASLGNGMIIVAILRSQNLQTPSYLLITSLAFTDLLMGLIFQPIQSVVFSYYFHGKHQKICMLYHPYIFIGALLSFASMMMVTCISIDRYLALTLRHRYNIIVTKKRVRLVIGIVWCSSCLIAALSTPEKLFNILFLPFNSSLLLVLLFITCLLYIKSFRALHLYTVQVQAQQPNPLAGNFDVVRYKKTLKTMVIVLACFVLCHAPLVVSLALVSFIDKKPFEAVIFYYTTLTIWSLNASINPVIYFIRFKDIRNTCLQMLRNINLQH